MITKTVTKVMINKTDDEGNDHGEEYTLSDDENVCEENDKRSLLRSVVCRRTFEKGV